MKKKKEIKVVKVRTPEEEKAFDLEMAKHAFDYAEENLENYVDNMVKRAERFVDELKQQRKYFNEKKDEEETARQGLMSREDCFRSILGTVQRCFNGYSAQDAARFITKYGKAKVYYKVMKEENVNVW